MIVLMLHHCHIPAVFSEQQSSSMSAKALELQRSRQKEFSAAVVGSCSEQVSLKVKPAIRVC